MVGEYLPTLKNGMVKDHYKTLGFGPIEGADTSQWLLNLDSYIDRECYIELKNKE